MKTFPFVQRTRTDESPAATTATNAATATTASKRPFRLWMTGSLAVVMAALSPMREVNATERSTLRLLRHSRFDVSETLQRIEDAARIQGLSVLARLAGARPVIVLASAVGGTLVVMDEADSQPAVPMSMMVRAVEGGGADVLVSRALRPEAADWHDLPATVARDLEALPSWVAQALA